MIFSFSFLHRRPPSELGVEIYVYIIISVMGFVVTDLFYIAAIINYAMQCQLITYLINVTVERVCRNRWIVDDAIKVHDGVISTQIIVYNINTKVMRIRLKCSLSLITFLDIELSFNSSTEKALL